MDTTSTALTKHPLNRAPTRPPAATAHGGREAAHCRGNAGVRRLGGGGGTPPRRQREPGVRLAQALPRGSAQDRWPHRRGAGAYDTISNLYTIYQASSNINDRIENMDKNMPPPGKSMIDINPETGNPYAIDEQMRSRRDFIDTTKDISDIGKSATDLGTPGPGDVLKDMLKKGPKGPACP